MIWCAILDAFLFIISFFFLYILYNNVSSFYLTYQIKFDSFLERYPNHLNFDNFYNILVYGYFNAFFVCMRPPFLWFHHVNHVIGFVFFIRIFLNREYTVEPNLDLIYLETWNSNFYDEDTFSKYAINFRILQWSLEDYSDILITRTIIIWITQVILIVINNQI